MNSSIPNYYGLTDLQRINVVSCESNSSEYVECSIETKELISLLNDQQFLAFLAFKTSRIIDRKASIPSLLEQRFCIKSEIICERQIKDFDGILRVCAVCVNRMQASKLLNMLFNLTNHAFAVSFDESSCSTLSAEVLNAFEEGILTPSVLSCCCKTVLSHGKSFLHVLRGCDGYSVNWFRPWDKGAVLREPG